MACFPKKKGRAKLETWTEAEVIWQDALIAGSGGQRRGEEPEGHGGWGAERSGDVGQNVKLEIIRAHRGADEWLIVVRTDSDGKTICALFAPGSPLRPPSPPRVPADDVSGLQRKSDIDRKQDSWLETGLFWHFFPQAIIKLTYFLLQPLTLLGRLASISQV